MNRFDHASADGVTSGLAELRSAVTDAPPPDVAAEHLDAIFAAQDAAGLARVRAHRTTVAMISGSAAAAVLLVASIGLRVPPRATAVETASPSIETVEVDVRRAVAARVAGDDPEKPIGVADREVEADELDPSQSPEIALSNGQTAPAQQNDLVNGSLSDAAPVGEPASDGGSNGSSDEDEGIAGGVGVPGESGPPAHANGGGAPEPGNPPAVGNQVVDPGNGNDTVETPAPDSGTNGRPDRDQIPDPDVPLETVLHGAPLESVMCDGLVATIVGSHGPDVIVGTEGPDVIVAGNGADIIDALGGDDVVCGGNGPDTVSGGDGDDRIFGGNGIDQLIGGLGLNEIDHGLGAPLGFEENTNRP